MYSLISKYEVYPLTVSYGQRHDREVFAARSVCAARGEWLLTRWKYLNLDNLRGILPSALTGVGEIPKGRYNETSMKQTVVPNRNMILLSLAAGYAEALGASHVAYAAHTEDHYIYADCRPEFAFAMDKSIRLGTDGKVELLTPFIRWSKVDIVALGKKLVVPFKMTWSCYKGEDRPCLGCGTCSERVLAFKLAGFPDPALTTKEWSKALEYLKEVTK